MKPCVMCKKEFEEKELDFLGRCEPCFKSYLLMKPDEKPNLGVPFTPGYNSTWKKG
jgi:DNA-directed RNA polymerase subunit RPC12/RpoP